MSNRTALRAVVPALALGLGCGGPAAPPVTAPPPAEPPIRITAGALGPLTADTPATLVALRGRLAGLQVVPVNRAEGLEYEVKRAGETLFYVIPDEAGRIFNVHVTSPRLTVADHRWGIGKQLAPADATRCVCWGGKPVCFKRGEHVAAAFDRPCEDDDDTIRARVAHDPIARVVWSPRGFESDDEDCGDDCDEDGGSDGVPGGSAPQPP